MSEKNAYSQSGVDVEIEARVSRIMYEASTKTFKNREGLIGSVVTPFDDFSGLRMVSVEKLPAGSFMSVGFDTAGTKVEIAQRVGIHNTIAFDVLAMVCDDAVMRGGEPVLVGTTLETSGFGNDERYLPIARELAEGYVAAANAANVAVINGEIVQMGSMVSGYGPFAYHWGAACVWFGRKDRLLTGGEMQEGDSIIALKEDGFRCNGWSLVRKIFREVYGEQWHKTAFEGSTLGLLALTPSLIYSKFIVELHGGFKTEGISKLRGVAHITGGGLPEKMSRLLRSSRLGARLNNLYDPAPIVSHCQKIGNVSDEDAYRAWNMGQGMMLVTNEPEKVLLTAEQRGIRAQVAGEIIKEPKLVITSRGIESPGKELVSDIR
ncbi:MAG: Phosphoribosylformylglycinamidine cyclo-ligase [Parcubacteria group bacterium GW2011_GWA2_51_10]|nr:MAG: Phosphoribosylformylglycinamidine cyclo-ligase [Parcubacteria group bacterium GW2011_GWA2_51_10]